MKITILGSSHSLGTPAPGGFWGVCDPTESKNDRTRASILVESATTKVLVDTTYDLRTHLNRHELKWVDGVLLSHAHSDHVNGIDDLRVMSYHHQKMVDIYSNKETLDEVGRRWPYLYGNDGSNKIYTPFIRRNEVENYGTFRIGDIEIETFEQDHTTCTSLGFRFGAFAYSVDVADLTDKSLDVLRGVETWVVDASSYHRETILTHANLQRVKRWVEILKPKMTYLTVLTTHMDYKTLCEELPPHIRPCYDGMVIDMESNQR